MIRRRFANKSTIAPQLRCDYRRHPDIRLMVSRACRIADLQMTRRREGHPWVCSKPTASCRKASTAFANTARGSSTAAFGVRNAMRTKMLSCSKWSMTIWPTENLRTNQPRPRANRRHWMGSHVSQNSRRFARRCWATVRNWCVTAAADEDKKSDGGPVPHRDSLTSDLNRTRAPYSLLSMFQKTGVAGPSRTPVSDFRHALGARYWPSGT